jgi:CRISPR-associated endonuclease/helicase Cas3
VLCTATQPVLTSTQPFDARKQLRGLPPPQPIVDTRDSLYAHLDRVRVEWPRDLQQPVELASVAELITQEDCALAVVGTRKDAAELLAAVDAACGTRALHLSAAMCGQHRADVIAEIRARLLARRQGRSSDVLHVVSTQLIEAGVDVDFPAVFRAIAGLDSIAQAAGRCNREGILGSKGRVCVFVRKIPTALHALRNAVQATISTLGDTRPTSLLPQHFERYFCNYYDSFPNHDSKGIVDLLRNHGDLAMSFRSAANAFRLIDDDDQVSLIVPYASLNANAHDVHALIARLRKKDSDRWLLRALQRYVVQMRSRAASTWQQRGDIEELLPGLFVLKDPLRYDVRRGLVTDEDPRQPVLMS